MQFLERATEQNMVDALVAAEGDTALLRRGYAGRTSLFAGWPTDSEWIWASLSLEELQSVHLIRNEKSWIDRAGPTRSPRVAAEWVRSNADDETAIQIASYNSQFRRGGRPPPVILVGPPQPLPTDLVVLEGNRRVVALCMGGADVTDVKFLIGTSSGMSSWLWYDDGLDGGPH